MKNYRVVMVHDLSDDITRTVNVIAANARDAKRVSKRLCRRFEQPLVAYNRDKEREMERLQREIEKLPA